MNLGQKKDSEDSLLFASDTDPILVKFADAIKDFGYVTGELYLQQSDTGDNLISDRSRLVTKKSSAQALTPSKLFDESLKLAYRNETYELGVTEQLYTARGEQGVGISDQLLESIDVDPTDYTETILFETTNYGGYSTRMLQRPLFSIDHKPDYYIGKTDYVYMSLPMYSFFANKDLDDIPFKYLLIRLNDPTDKALSNQIAKEFKQNVRR